MRQGAGQAEPDPVSPVSSSARSRRSGRRRWLVLMLTLLVPVGLGVYGWGWLTLTDALRLGGVLGFGSVVRTAIQTSMDYDGTITIVHGGFSKGARARFIALGISYGVLCGVAAPVGAWLAR